MKYTPFNIASVIVLSFLFTIGCKPKPKLVPTPADSRIKKFSILVPHDKAIILDDNLICAKQSNSLADFSFTNLDVSPEYKSIITENAVAIAPIIISDGMFDEIKDSASFVSILNQATYLPSNLITDLNTPNAPHSLSYKYYNIINPNNKQVILRIDNYKPGIKQDLEATVIIGK